MKKLNAKIDWIHPTGQNAKFDMLGHMQSARLLIVVPTGASPDSVRFYEGVTSSDFERLRQEDSKSYFLKREFGIDL